MIARHRGDLRVHSRWRPSTPAVSPATAGRNRGRCPAQPATRRAPQRAARPGPATGQSAQAARADRYRHHRRGRGHRWPAAHRVGASRAAPALHPQQWVSHWTAATLQSPAEVCDHLYAPALSRAFKGDTGHSCASYYTSVKSTSFRIRHVLEDGPTAAVEAQEVGAGRKRGYFTMLLSHVRGGWQAVDVVPGGSVRAR